MTCCTAAAAAETGSGVDGNVYSDILWIVEVCSRYNGSDHWNLVSFHNNPKMKHIHIRRKRG